MMSFQMRIRNAIDGLDFKWCFKTTELENILIFMESVLVAK